MAKISVITPTIRPEGLEITKKSLSEQTFTDFEWLVEVGLGKKHDLNAALNRLIQRSSGELIVFLQDYIQIKPEGLQTFLEAYEKDKRTFYTAPVGKSDSLEFDNPKWDWRNAIENFRRIDWMHCEMDWACAPKSALVEIGGFDEALDDYWSFDNVNLCFRADMAVYKFENIPNHAIAYDHDKFIEHPFRKNFNPEFHNRRLDQFRQGLKLHYL